jgi:cbb3-type cytochrome oxidase cytochrome c subunit
MAAIGDSSDPSLIQTGQDLFAIKGCAGCHKLNGIGGELGPDLSNEGNILIHDAAWHGRHFKNPQSVAPGSSMPNMSLSDPEIEALTAYMLSLKNPNIPKETENAINAAQAALVDARKGIDEVKEAGFNVDALEIRYMQGWTRLQTIDNKIYTHNLEGIHQETDEAIKISKEIREAVAGYREELGHRVNHSLILIALMGGMAVLVFIKVLTV